MTVRLYLVLWFYGSTLTNCTAEAAQIVLNAPVKKTMVPLNVTHTAIVTPQVHRVLLDPANAHSTELSQTMRTKTALRRTLSTLIGFFSASYESTFGFSDGPPLHDAVAVAYAACPELFTCTRRRVDVELAGTHTAGETVVDVWNYRSMDQGENAWGREGRNCLVAEKLDVPKFFDFFLDCVERCDEVSPLNHPSTSQ